MKWFALILILLLTTLNGCVENGLNSQKDPLDKDRPIGELQPNGQQSQEQNEQQQYEPKSGELIGSYTTEIIDRKDERVNNIQMAMMELKDITIAPEQVFSFNDTVGARTKEAGYERAYIYIGEEKKLDYGGGVCQISSTIYNAALKAGLEIVERHPHEVPVDYVPEGMDATVSFGNQDLKFKNTKPYPIILNLRDEYFNIIADIIRK